MKNFLKMLFDGIHDFAGFKNLQKYKFLENLNTVVSELYRSCIGVRQELNKTYTRLTQDLHKTYTRLRPDLDQT